MESNKTDRNSTIGMDVLDAAQRFDGRQVAGMYNEAIVKCVADDDRYVSVLRTVLTWMTAGDRKSRMAAMREDMITGVRLLLGRHGGREADVAGLGFSPVISEDPLDENNSFTLDRVREDGDSVVVESSSCSGNITRDIRELDLDTLAALLDFLEENEDSVWEPSEETEAQ